MALLVKRKHLQGAFGIGLITKKRIHFICNLHKKLDKMNLKALILLILLSMGYVSVAQQNNSLTAKKITGMIATYIYRLMF
jgi:hypothetical protein